MLSVKSPRHLGSLASAALEEADQKLRRPKVGTFAGLEKKSARRLLEKAAFKVVRFVPFGIKSIDRVLPGGGLALGCLHEVAGGGNGAIDGAAAALFAAGIAAKHATVRLCPSLEWRSGNRQAVPPHAPLFRR